MGNDSLGNCTGMWHWYNVCPRYVDFGIKNEQRHVNIVAHGLGHYEFEVGFEVGIVAGCYWVVGVHPD